MVFDGDCSFCRRWVGRWRSTTGDRIEYAPYQLAAPRFPQVQPEAFGRAVHLIEPDGHASRGAQAVFRSLALAHVKHWPWWAYRFVPLFAAITERAYRFIADHRNGFDKLDGIFIGWHDQASTYLLSRSLFLRGLGLVCLIAFTSLWVQIHGLIGSRGILPIANLVHSLRHYPAQKYWLMPTLCWLNASDGMLTFLCAAGVVLSGLLIVGMAPAIALLLLWIDYLSLVVAGQVFLGFQWDSLLLEAGFAALFCATAGAARPSADRPASFAKCRRDNFPNIQYPSCPAGRGNAIPRILAGQGWRDYAGFRAAGCLAQITIISFRLDAGIPDYLAPALFLATSA